MQVHAGDGATNVTRKATLRQAQQLWDADHHGEAVALLEGELPYLHPKSSATDALIVATLAVYWSDLGNPHRGLGLLDELPLDASEMNDVLLLCLASRSSCRAAAGDLAGAQTDRDTIARTDPNHLSLVVAEMALFNGHGT